MVGYRFYHDESIDDGEYITLTGIEVNNGLRIPNDRGWFINKADKFLRVDYMRTMKVSY